MKKLLLLLIIPFLSFGQGWIQTYGNPENNQYDWAECVRGTSDGGSVVVTTQDLGGYISVILKLDTEGNTEWSVSLDDSFYNLYSSFAKHIEQTSDGGYIISGSAQYYNNEILTADLFLTKLDSEGNAEWFRFYEESNLTYSYNGIESTWQNFSTGSDEGEGLLSVQQTLDGGYVVIGSIRFGCVAQDVGGFWSARRGYLLKVDSQGDVEWEQSFMGGDWLDVLPGFEEYFSPNQHTAFRSVIQTLDGGYAMCGEAVGNDLDGDGAYDRYHCVIKTDSEGNEEWTYIYNASEDDSSNSIKQTSDGGYVVVGSDTAVQAVDEYGGVYFIGSGVMYKIDSNGALEWYQNVLNSSVFEDVEIDGNDYVIVGREVASSASSYVYTPTVLKVNSYGDIIWKQRYFCSSGFGESISKTNDGGYVITGLYESSIVYNDIYVIKINNIGCVNDLNNNGICDEEETGYDCNGNCFYDEDEDLICDEDEVYGCTDSMACNFVFFPFATEDDGSCEYPEEDFDCDGNCIIEVDCTGVCGGTAIIDDCGVCDGDGTSCIGCNYEGESYDVGESIFIEEYSYFYEGELIVSIHNMNAMCADYFLGFNWLGEVIYDYVWIPEQECPEGEELIWLSADIIPNLDCVDDNSADAVSVFGGCSAAITIFSDLGGCDYVLNGVPLSDLCPQTCDTCFDDCNVGNNYICNITFEDGTFFSIAGEGYLYQDWDYSNGIVCQSEMLWSYSNSMASLSFFVSPVTVMAICAPDLDYTVCVDFDIDYGSGSLTVGELYFSSDDNVSCQDSYDTSIQESSSTRSLINTVDILGRESKNNKGIQLHIYDDGSVEKRYIIE